MLEAFLAPGSELWMFNEVPEKDRERKLTDGGLDISGLENIKLVHREGNAVIRRHLENLPLETFDSVSQMYDHSIIWICLRPKKKKKKKIIWICHSLDINRFLENGYCSQFIHVG